MLSVAVPAPVLLGAAAHAFRGCFVALHGGWMALDGWMDAWREAELPAASAARPLLTPDPPSPLAAATRRPTPASPAPSCSAPCTGKPRRLAPASLATRLDGFSAPAAVLLRALHKSMVPGQPVLAALLTAPPCSAPARSLALSPDPLLNATDGGGSPSDVYLAVGLDSGMTAEDFKRKQLNLVSPRRVHPSAARGRRAWRLPMRTWVLFVMLDRRLSSGGP